jgi:hypothetical protein
VDLSAYVRKGEKGSLVVYANTFTRPAKKRWSDQSPVSRSHLRHIKDMDNINVYAVMLAAAIRSGDSSPHRGGANSRNSHQSAQNCSIARCNATSWPARSVAIDGRAST